MLLGGTIQNLKTTPDMTILNFSSLNVRFPELKLFPPYEMGVRSDYEFDLKYAEYLLFNEAAFIDFMQIPYNIYLGHDVFILIDDGEEFENINESLFKFLQQRYGLNVSLITDYEDFINATEVKFSELGRLNFHNDKERLALLLEKGRLMSGGYVGEV